MKDGDKHYVNNSSWLHQLTEGNTTSWQVFNFRSKALGLSDAAYKLKLHSYEHTYTHEHMRAHVHAHTYIISHTHTPHEQGGSSMPPQICPTGSICPVLFYL